MTGDSLEVDPCRITLGALRSLCALWPSGTSFSCGPLDSGDTLQALIPLVSLVALGKHKIQDLGRGTSCNSGCRGNSGSNSADRQGVRWTGRAFAAG